MKDTLAALVGSATDAIVTAYQNAALVKDRAADAAMSTTTPPSE